MIILWLYLILQGNPSLILPSAHLYSVVHDEVVTRLELDEHADLVFSMGCILRRFIRQLYEIGLVRVEVKHLP